MRVRQTIGLVVAISAFAIGFRQGIDPAAFHRDAVVVDTHNDAAQRMTSGEDLSQRTSIGHSDLPRLREGGVDVEVFSIWVPPEKTERSYYDQAEEQIDSVLSLVRRNPHGAILARSAVDIEAAVHEGKLSAMMGMEGGHPLEGRRIENLRHFYERGVRYMTLTWNNSTAWATSAKDETDPGAHLPQKGLTDAGREIVRTMNTLGMIVDVSHVGEKTFWDVIATSSKPVIASHSSVWNLCPHRRNLKDDQIRAIAKKGGAVFINFNPAFIDSTFSRKEGQMRAPRTRQIDSLLQVTPGDEFTKENAIGRFLAAAYKPIRPSLSLLVDHIDYVAKLVGPDYVGIGSDFDGIYVTPLDMDDVTFLPNITRELLKRGYKEPEVEKILGGNFLRILKEVERR